MTNAQNVVVLEPDLASAFPNDDAVNQALRLVLQLVKVPYQQTVAASVYKKGSLCMETPFLQPEGLRSFSRGF